jgi:hypothetical protein
MHISRCKRLCPKGNFELCAADMRLQTTENRYAQMFSNFKNRSSSKHFR